MTSEIYAAAGAVAEARLNADQAAAASVKASAHRDHIRGRIAAFEDDRSKIAAERKGGVDDPAHGARLAVIAVDLDGLGQILAEANQAVAKAGAEVAAANSTVTTAEAALAAASDAELLRRLADHADTLDALLFDTVSDIAAVSQRLGRRPPWSPRAILVSELRRLDLTRGQR
jgi:hypothetical protein